MGAFAQKRLLFFSAVFAVALSVLLSSVILYSELSNVNATKYCSITSIPAALPDAAGDTYVASPENSFRLYDPIQDKDEREFLVQWHGAEYKISESNWMVQGAMCKLKSAEIFADFLPMFLFYFFISFVLMSSFGLIVSSAVMRRK